MGYWQNGLEIEKKVCDFKVPLGCLGSKKTRRSSVKHSLLQYSKKKIWKISLTQKMDRVAR